MPSRPIEVHHKKDAARNKSSYSHNHSAQHGKTVAPSINAGILLHVPSETLTHITSFLDPRTLLALDRTNKQLHAHVKDDNTWRRAYVYQFLGISPEADLRDNAEGRSLMLRREETTWRREFVLRYNLRRNLGIRLHCSFRLLFPARRYHVCARISNLYWNFFFLHGPRLSACI